MTEGMESLTGPRAKLYISNSGAEAVFVHVVGNSKVCV